MVSFLLEIGDYNTFMTEKDFINSVMVLNECPLNMKNLKIVNSFAVHSKHSKKILTTENYIYELQLNRITAYPRFN